MQQDVPEQVGMKRRASPLQSQLVVQNFVGGQDFPRIPARDPGRDRKIALIGEELDAMPACGETAQTEKLVWVERSAVPKGPKDLAIAGAAVSHCDPSAPSDDRRIVVANLGIGNAEGGRSEERRV